MEGNYYKKEDTVKEYIKLAEDINGKALIKELAKHIKKNATVLEIGSGPGSDWKILNESYNTTGSDNSVEFLKHLYHKYPKGSFIELDAINIETSETFDAIYSNKVLQHLTNEELSASIVRQSDTLNLGGIICHSFWKGEGSEIFNGLFVNYHIKETLITQFSENFEIISMTDYEEFEPNDSILLIAKKR